LLGGPPVQDHYDDVVGVVPPPDGTPWRKLSFFEFYVSGNSPGIARFVRLVLSCCDSVCYICIKNVPARSTFVCRQPAFRLSGPVSPAGEGRPGADFGKKPPKLKKLFDIGPAFV
jgi:hypothetical protein